MTGFLNLDKPEGVSSAYLVNGVKRLVRQAFGKLPCGHMGTLDPLASGVLPIAVGNATRLFDYFLGKKKTYRARFIFGATTETLDREGDRIDGGMVPSAEEIEAALPRFCGKILQKPPKYSAKNLNGEKSYRLARRGEEFVLPAKEVEIFSFELLGKTAEDEFEFSITCGGGTYIRALSRDLASALGTLGFTSMLRRTASGPFTQDTAIPLERLTAENLKNYIIPADMVLPFPVMEVDDPRFYNGVPYAVDRADGVYKVYRGGAFYGTGTVEGGVLRAGKKLC